MIEVSQSSNVGIIRINYSDTLNALSENVLKELYETFEGLLNDKSIRVIIITGIGRTFVAGADIRSMAKMNLDEAYKFALYGANVFKYIEFADKVTIAAINGFALGGGSELAMACDIRIASEKAKFGQPEVGLGIIPGFSGIRRMMEIVGEAKAKEFIFSGRMFNAQEAERIGLVNKVVPADSLMEECQIIADEIASKSINAVITSKKVMNALKTNVDEIIRFQSGCFADCFNHRDQKIGMEAFLNKEAPSF